MRRIVRSLGVVIAVVGVLFVVRELARSWDDVRDAIAGAHLGLLAAGLAVGSMGPLIIGLGWRRCLAVLGARRPIREVLHWYYLGQLGKYVPGGVWTVIGRGELARRGGVAPSIGYAGTVLSLGITYLAAVLVVAVVLAAGAAGREGVPWQPIVALLPVGVLALHPRFAEALLRMGRRLTRRDLPLTVPSWGVSIGLLVWHVPAWLAIGTGTWLVAAGLDATPDIRNLLFATVLSWVVGFLVVPSPGGIGVREAVFVAAATSLGSAGVAAAVAVVARAVFILVDLAGAGLSTVMARKRVGAESSGTQQEPAS